MNVAEWGLIMLNEGTPFSPGVWLSRTLNEVAAGEMDRAMPVLGKYYAPLSGRDDGFTGGAWDTFDPSATRAASANTFTSDDLASCSLLATPIRGRATVELLDRQRRRFELLLEKVGPDRDFIGVPVDEDGYRESMAAAVRLYRALDELPDVGPTRASKLLARKRPRLVPIVDDVILRTIFRSGPYQWQPLRAAFDVGQPPLWDQLTRLREDAGLSEAVTVLRIFDVLAWMDGLGNANGLRCALLRPDAPDDLLPLRCVGDGSPTAPTLNGCCRSDGHRGRLS